MNLCKGCDETPVPDGIDLCEPCDQDMLRGMKALDARRIMEEMGANGWGTREIANYVRSLEQ